MGKIKFTDNSGTFVIENPENYSGLYLPLAGEKELKSSITPTLAGDSKTDQNHFLFEPVSIENLHNNKNGRNFWCLINGSNMWSVSGASAMQEAEKFSKEQDESKIEAGLMWQRLTRVSKKFGIRAEVLSFVPVDENIEIMYVTLKNISDNDIDITPIAALPIYGRSADNLRDHRHVTSLLHRIETKEYGVEVAPVLSFDERGHRKNETTYFVYGSKDDGEKPKEFYPTNQMFIGEGGSFLMPEAVRTGKTGVNPGTKIQGKEATGAFAFGNIKLKAGEKTGYIMLAGVTTQKDTIESRTSLYRTKVNVIKCFEKTKKHWKDKVNIDFEMNDKAVDNYLKWICFQPILRRIYGCSFLPYHDYGKGGRGWRDLWQDCLALLVMEPDMVRKMIVSNYGGVRIDGTNATIIGNGQGKFIADRNNITRVWMDRSAAVASSATPYTKVISHSGCSFAKLLHIFCSHSPLSFDWSSEGDHTINLTFCASLPVVLRPHPVRPAIARLTPMIPVRNAAIPLFIIFIPSSFLCFILFRFVSVGIIYIFFTILSIIFIFYIYF